MAAITGEQAYAQRLQVTHQALRANSREGDERGEGDGGGGRSGSGREARGDALGVATTGPPTPPKSPEIGEKEQGRQGQEGQNVIESIIKARDTIQAIQSLQFGEITEATWGVTQVALHTAIGGFKAAEARIAKLETRLEKTGRDRNASIGYSRGSWAQVAGTSMGTRSWQSPGPRMGPGLEGARGSQPLKQLDVRRMREVVVRFGDEEGYRKASQMKKEELIKSFINPANTATKNIVGAYTRGTTDVVLQTATVEGREALERMQEWASVAYPSAKVVRKTFYVAAEGACINLLDEKEKEKGLARIREDNVITHPNTDFTSFGWAKHAARLRQDGSKKTCSTLIIGVATPEAVNRLVRGGIALGGSLLVCKRWEQGAEIRQCFNCHGYGHFARECRREKRCGYYAGSHSLADHVTGEGVTICVAYRGGYKAWSKDCPVRRREYQRVV